MRAIFLIAIALIFPSQLFAVETEPFGKYTVAEVAALLGKPDVFIFDANSEGTFLAGHVPGAVHVDYNDYAESVLPRKKEATLIFYCKNQH